MMLNGRYREMTVIALVMALTAVATYTSLQPSHAQTTIQTEDTTMPTFPTVAGRNIDGESFSLPADFEGDYNIAMLAFTQEQQSTVNTWVDALRTLEANNNAVRIYELPTLPNFNWIQRRQLDFWMSAGIPDPLTRATTITLYTDVNAVLEATSLEDTTVMRLILVDREGNIYWQDEGAYTEAKYNGLLDALDDLAETP